MKVTFTFPKNGWMPVTIEHGDETLIVDASYMPYTSLDDLVGALNLVLQGVGTADVSWCTEPVEYVFHFVLNVQRPCLAIYEYPDHRRNRDHSRKVMRIEGTPLELVLPFWRGLRELQTLRPINEFRRAWNLPFPSSRMERLNELVSLARRRQKRIE